MQRFIILNNFINKRNLILFKIHFQANKSKGARKIFFCSIIKFIKYLHNFFKDLEIL
jgi:hypothetical protein